MIFLNNSFFNSILAEWFFLLCTHVFLRFQDESVLLLLLLLELMLHDG